MKINTPPMGWNTWNTFGEKINEKLIMETVDILVGKGYRDAGYEYVIIDDCWHLPERQNGKQVPNPELFPNGMKYLADYIHSKGLKFGMYSCCGFKTCADLPGSYGYEWEDAQQFAEWGVDYLKYDSCYRPENASVNSRLLYTTMSMALKNCGRDILFAACNWGEFEAEKWMRAAGAHTYRSTPDIFDNKKSFSDIFASQIEKISVSGNGTFNDMDMLIVGMNGKGNVGLGGCTAEEYLMHFAMWAFMGSPLIIGGDIRNMDKACEDILLNKNLIALNQDSDALPPFLIGKMPGAGRTLLMGRMLAEGKIAMGMFNLDNEEFKRAAIAFEDLGIPMNKGIKVKLTDAVTGVELGVYEDSFLTPLEPMQYKVLIGEIIK